LPKWGIETQPNRASSLNINAVQPAVLAYVKHIIHGEIVPGDGTDGCILNLSLIATKKESINGV
jgi:hypothetical protein